MGIGPVFVVGTMRSGSTLLRLLLDSHPSFAIGPETGFGRAAAAMLSIPDWDRGEGWYRAYGLDDETMRRRVAGFFDELFTEWAHGRGKARWGEKTPFHVWQVAELAELFPSATFVGIVRHPAATVASTRRWRYGTADAVSKWVRANGELLHRAAELEAGRAVIVRYEDLVLRPAPTLGALLAALGEDWSDDVLAHHRVQAATGGPLTAEGGTRTDAPIDPSRALRGADDLASADLAVLTERVPPALLDALGYRLDEPVPGPLPTVLVPVTGHDLSTVPRGKHARGDFDPERDALPRDPELLAHELIKARRELEWHRAPAGERVRRSIAKVRRRAARERGRRIAVGRARGEHA